MIVFILAITYTVQAANPPSESLIRDWLISQTNESHMSGNSDMGLYVEWTEKITSLYTSQELEKKWNEIKRYPDHPERFILALHRQRLNKPELNRGHIWYADRRNWLIEDISSDGSAFTRGGSGKTRWALYDDPSSDGQTNGQLTLIKSGVPFPSGYNISKYLDMLHQRLSLFQLRGIPFLTQISPTQSVKTKGFSWSFFIRLNSSIVIEINGNWDASRNQAYITKINQKVKSQTDKLSLISISYMGFEFNDELERNLPNRIIYDTGDGFRHDWRILKIKRYPKKQIAAKCKPPEDTAGFKVADFRSPNSPALNAYSSSDKMTWFDNQDGDSFDIETNIHNKSTSSVSTTTASSDITNTKASDTHSSTPKYVALGLVILVIIILPILIYRYKN